MRRVPAAAAEVVLLIQHLGVLRETRNEARAGASAAHVGAAPSGCRSGPAGEATTGVLIPYSQAKSLLSRRRVIPEASGGDLPEEQKCDGKTNEEDLVYRVPIFDPALPELYSPPPAL